MKILHIAPHLGGGVGRFCSNVYGKDDTNEHVFLLLEQPIDLQLINILSWVTFDELKTDLDRYLQLFDIVQIEFWNHPLIFKFLIQHNLNKCHLIIYVHTSGIYAPNIIPPLLFELGAVVVLSTPASKSMYQKYIDDKKAVFIHGLGGCDITSSLTRKQHDGFKIAYIGTASYGKLHHDFVDSCMKIIEKIPNVEFLFASNDDNLHLQREIKIRGIENHFKFYLKLSDVREILRLADIFGYPLTEEHFGTGEQSLLEAMGAGIPPVVMNNPAELSLIQDGKTGFVAKSISEYVNLVKFCHQNQDFLNLISQQTKKYALKNFSSSNTIEKFNSLYKQLVKNSKVNHSFKTLISHFPCQSIGWNLYKMCLGNIPEINGFEASETMDAKMYFKYKIMCSDVLYSENKGGLKAYKQKFPDDIILNQF
jgi:L-malate glycosyltransferase